MKHTEGTWSIDPIHKNRVRLESGIGTGGETICICDSSNIDTDNEANARLIAAAPELLEALIEAEKTIEYLQQKYISMEQKDDHAATRSGNTRRKAIEAINKATQDS